MRINNYIVTGAMILAAEALPAAPDFAFTPAEGWEVRNLATGQQASSSTNGMAARFANDGQLLNESVSFSASQVNAFALDLTVQEAPLPEKATLFWTSDGQPISQEKSVVVAIPQAGRQTLTFNLAGHPLWAGTIEGLRLDPISKPGSVLLHSLKVASGGPSLHSPAPAASATASGDALVWSFLGKKPSVFQTFHMKDSKPQPISGQPGEQGTSFIIDGQSLLLQNRQEKFNGSEFTALEVNLKIDPAMPATLVLYWAPEGTPLGPQRVLKLQIPASVERRTVTIPLNHDSWGGPVANFRVDVVPQEPATVTIAGIRFLADGGSAAAPAPSHSLQEALNAAKATGKQRILLVYTDPDVSIAQRFVNEGLADPKITAFFAADTQLALLNVRKPENLQRLRQTAITRIPTCELLSLDGARLGIVHGTSDLTAMAGEVRSLLEQPR